MRSRVPVLVSLIAIALLVAAPQATACDKGKTCDVKRSCEKTDTGYRCTIIATGETDIAAVRECVRSCSSKDCKPEGVTVTIEDIEGGVAVTCGSDDPAQVKKMHAKASECDKAAGHSCCAKGEAHAAEDKDCDHAADDKDCDHAAGKKCCTKKTST